ncbi:MAG: hypothetical protein ACOX6V_03185 [Patescibacteria group bacterium]|jgi:hypothetical protein
MSILVVKLFINREVFCKVRNWLEKYALFLIIAFLSVISIGSFIHFHHTGLSLAYNDARSHLDIGRRVVEGLKPGLAQLGSVWLPLTHILMIPTIWNDFMWHSGLSGSIQSMAAFVITGILIFKFLEKIGVGLLGKIIGVLVFAANINILYLQSTAMTELLLLATMTAGVYELLNWYQNNKLLNLITASFWIMLSTLIRYDGWFLFVVAAVLVAYKVWKESGLKVSLSMVTLFSTLAGFGIVMWFLWNQLIFKDALYFIFGPFSAHAQQQRMEVAGVLDTKWDATRSIRTYLYALFYNSNTFTALLAFLGSIIFYIDKKISSKVRIVSLALLAPLVFNILALYMGHSVLFVQGISGDTWFNIRYGVMLMPSIAVFIGYLIEKLKAVRWTILGLLFFTTAMAFVSFDAVTIDDARVGSSQKNVTEVAGWLEENAKNRDEFILISAASHDAIIFSSGLPMKRFIHEGTGEYWESATETPDRWVRWIVLRTQDATDLTFVTLEGSGWEEKYSLVDSYPFAEIYELKPQYLSQLKNPGLESSNTVPVSR